MYKLKYSLTIGGQRALLENASFFKNYSSAEIDKLFKKFDKEAEKDWKKKYKHLGQSEPIIGREQVERVLNRFFKAKTGLL